MEGTPAGPPGEGGTESTALAAVDLGSNSFHMVVGHEVDGVPRLVDRIRERVALAEGLRPDGTLEHEVGRRALECLDRFGQRLTGISSSRIRAVGTATMRRLEHAEDFLREAESRLGHPIEILPGAEEARLVYLGVAHLHGDDEGRRLVVDIGGASTECVLGERFEAQVMNSLSMGCVVWSARYFPGGELTVRAMQRAELAAQIELEPHVRKYRDRGWSECIGSSGTVLAIEEILEAQGWAEDGITEAGLARLSEALTEAGHVDRVELLGLKEDRRPVIAGGLAILRALFRSLQIRRMTGSKGALREGLIFDLLGRIHHEDVRERSVKAFADRYDVDAGQAERVAATALALFDSIHGGWALSEDDRSMLRWAARVHEVGLVVDYRNYHRHGAYLIENSNLPGFSADDRTHLGYLVRCHRRKPPPDLLREKRPGRPAWPLVVLLRLAVLFHRGRGDLSVPPLILGRDALVLRLVLPDGWLDVHPLTRADLDVEVALLGRVGLSLDVREA